jgi:release factor glutamine methyltransferase
LIPRPETEFLVERVIELARACKDTPLIADIGTGSGCIAVSVAASVPDVRIIATDISAAALAVAKDNAQTHNVVERIEFFDGDLFSSIAGRDFERRIDVIASNPPYISVDVRDDLQREVRDWEPELALYGGKGGLDFYRRLLAECPVYLRPGGFLVCEIGYDQVNYISEMADTALWDLTDVIKDLQGLPRVMSFRLTG